MIDNRSMAYVQRFLDQSIEDFKNTIWNSLLCISDVKPPVYKDGMPHCPSCGALITARTEPNFCKYCGQAFVWPSHAAEDEP